MRLGEGAAQIALKKEKSEGKGLREEVLGGEEGEGRGKNKLPSPSILRPGD